MGIVNVAFKTEVLVLYFCSRSTDRNASGFSRIRFLKPLNMFTNVCIIKLYCMFNNSLAFVAFFENFYCQRYLRNKKNVPLSCSRPTNRKAWKFGKVQFRTLISVVVASI